MSFRSYSADFARRVLAPRGFKLDEDRESGVFGLFQDIEGIEVYSRELSLWVLRILALCTHNLRGAFACGQRFRAEYWFPCRLETLAKLRICTGLVLDHLKGFKETVVCSPNHGPRAPSVICCNRS